MALGGNSGIVAAQQRYLEAKELVSQVDAEGRPQIGVAAQDTYTSYPAYAPALGIPSVQNPVLPGGSIIPPVVDAAGVIATGFIGAGGALGASSIQATPAVAASYGASVSGPAASGPGSASPAGVSATESADALAAVPRSPVIPTIVAGFLTRPSTLLPVSGSGQSDVPVVADARESVRASSAGGPAEPAATRQSVAAAQSQTQAPIPASASTASPAKSGENNLAARISGVQFLDLFGVLRHERSAESDYSRFYALDVTRVRNETALVAKNLFFNLLFADAQVATAQEQVDDATEDVRITQDRYTQGIAAHFDVLTAQTALSAGQQQLTAAEDQRELAHATLAYLLGLDPNQPITLVAPTLPAQDSSVDLPSATRIALAHRPEIAEADVDISEANNLVKVAAAGTIPAVGIVGTGIENGTATPTAPQGYGEISAEASAAIDDGGATRSRVRAAHVAVQAQDLSMAQLQQSVRLEVREAAVNIRNAQAEVASATAGLAEAREAVRLSRERYRAGVGTLLDILNALAQLAVTRTNLANAQYFYQSSLAQLVRAMGGR